LVEYLKWGLGRKIEIAAFGRTASSRLKEAADRFINFEDLSRLLIKIRTKQK